MKTNTNVYRRCRFPPEVISRAVWLYHRFCLSFRDIEDLLAERGVGWHLDEVFVKIRGELRYLWRAVDQDGDLIDILVQLNRAGGAVSIGPRGDLEPLQSRTPHDASRTLQVVTYPLFRRMECGSGDMTNSGRPCVSSTHGQLG